MSDLQYKDFTNIKYQLIFDFYDRPLSFVARIKTKDYLFFFIAKNEYFMAEVNHDVANKLNEFKDLTKLFDYLDREKKIKVLRFKNDKQIEIIDLDKLPSAKKFLPKVVDKIDFDYQHEIPIKQDTDLLQYLN